MATDRMYLRCPCGDEIALASYLMPPWQAYPHLTERLNAWFFAHQDHEEGHWPARPVLITRLVESTANDDRWGV
jgi:hypothetical protein